MKAEELKKFKEELDEALTLCRMLLKKESGLECFLASERIQFRNAESMLAFAKEEGLNVVIVKPETYTYEIGVAYKGFYLYTLAWEKEYSHYKKEGLLP